MRDMNYLIDNVKDKEVKRIELSDNELRALQRGVYCLLQNSIKDHGIDLVGLDSKLRMCLDENNYSYSTEEVEAVFENSVLLRKLIYECLDEHCKVTKSPYREKRVRIHGEDYTLKLSLDKD